MNAIFDAKALAALVEVPEPTAPHRGMPTLERDGPELSFYEFWPMKLFYAPAALYAIWLMLRHRGVMLPTAANPSFPAGGLIGESKAEILALACRHVPEHVAPFVAIDRPNQPVSVEDEATLALGRLAAHGLSLPVVAKPDLGCRGVGVRLIRTREQLESYLARFPEGARIVLQRFVDEEGEAGVFYVRRPGNARGGIYSLTLKYFPYVIGDGRSTLRDLILDDPRASQVPHLYLERHRERLDTVPAKGEPIRLAFAGSHSRGAIFRDGTGLVTPEMEAAFDRIARRIPEFWFGRFDVRFRSFEEMRQGRGFTILEINGAGAEATHVWDRKTPLLKAWRDILIQYRLLFEIGRANVDRGFRTMPFGNFLRAWRREKELVPLYPPTE